MKGAAKRLGARPRSDREQLAAYVAALARAAVAPSEPGCTDPGEVAAGPAIRLLPQWPASNPSERFIPCALSRGGAHRLCSLPSALLSPWAMQRSRAAARATLASCACLRRQPPLHKKCASSILKLRHAALDGRCALSAGSARQRPKAQSCWLDEADPFAAAMRRWESHVPPGWHGLLRQTLREFLAVACSELRKAALTQLGMFCHSTELWWALPAQVSAVLLGIARKAQQRANWTCSACGCAGRRREMGEDGQATLCAPCAAPLLLEHDLWVLQQSLPFLRGVNALVSSHQIPKLLRPSFCLEVAGHSENHGPVGGGRMSPAEFLAWATLW